ncbi:MAG TPA: aldo/keto reductase [Leptolyngbyaceae cyanobacterium M33_DOE_097]|uniref:Aldo/keto reductase n=1 Tax=Oscillatoriales cyanobacterium SpSt-418 TaxID=2282169 RepID=A0A7C3KIS9_9CYAN|nr:aldo/keto reductase [Leptolyngbyaceae cyanobacterium M33_DOE_097]
MKYRRFGKTNLEISVFSLGTMRCLASEAIAQQTVERALDLGINHLETAQGYGASEIFLGKALRDLAVPRSQVILTTKILPSDNADITERAIDESLDRLDVDYLDTLALHGINTWDHLAWLTARDGCMRAIWRAVEDGRVRHIGFSTHAPLDVILAAIATEFFEFVNLHYTYFFQRNEAAIAAAHEKDMGVFIISPADKGGMLYTPPDRLVEACAPFPPLLLNYRFLLSDRRITTLSIGPAMADELEPVTSVMDQVDHLTAAERTALERLEAQQAETLSSDRCQQCYACLPCPESINIPEVLRLRNLAIAHDMTAFGQYRYRMFENAGHWFPGNKASRCTECGDCLPRCPENLNIPQLLFDAHEKLNGAPRRRLWESH